MTDSEFNLAVRKWARKVKNEANQALSAKTKSSGELNRSVRFSQKFYRGVTERIGFDFVKHGIFVQYGAGRGYIVKNGVLQRGYRASKDQIAILLQRGFSLQDARAVKYTINNARIKRKPVDWLNKPINGNIEKLADICQAYYGDKTMEHLLNNYDHLLIGKQNGKRR